MTGKIARLRAWWSARNNAGSPEQPTVHQSVEVGSEAPIRTKSEDLLRRADFASHIADVLSELSPREGRVFAIRGGWGFGKSSLKYLVIERLESQEKAADWLDFNPWQWGDGNAISRALFGQIADQLGGDNSKAAIARAEALRRYGAILEGASAPLKKAGESNAQISSVLTNASVIVAASAIGFDLPTVAMVAAALAGLSIVTSVIGRVLSLWGRDKSNEPLDKVREALETRLGKLARPLIVFVDDIDRLEPDQIRLLIRQVKANANLPNIVFVLLFQPSIVERALDPVAHDNGRAFLEKIVQASFDLPAVPAYMVYRIFGEQVSQLAGGFANEANGFDEVRWGNAMVGCIQPRLRNIRDAQRLLSSIAVHMPLHVSGSVFEVNIVDFLVLETLRVFEPDLHEALFQERALVLQERNAVNERRQEVVKESVEQLLNKVPEERRLVARDTLKELFPPLEWALGGTHYDGGFRSQWLVAKRVCSSRYFPRYFELQTALGEVSERQFVEFLEATASKQELAAAVADIESEGLLPSLVSRLDESVDRLPVGNAAVLLPAMFSIGQKLVRFRGDPFSSPYVSAWRATSWYLKAIPPAERGGLVLEALRGTKALSVAAMLIHLSDPADNKPGKRDKFDPALDEETVEAMKSLWVQIIRAHAVTDVALIAEDDLVSLLYRWRDYAKSIEEPRRWMAEAIKGDEDFAKIVSAMMSTGKSHSVRDRVSKVHKMFSREAVEDFIGLGEAQARCDAIDPARFPEHEESLRTLKRHLDAWRENEGDLLYM